LKCASAQRFALRYAQPSLALGKIEALRAALARKQGELRVAFKFSDDEKNIFLKS
jgi:hypothetical protein